MSRLLKSLLSTASALVLAGSANAAVISFTGGTATLVDASTGATNNSVTYSTAVKYEELGFRVEFIGGTSYVGNYYGAGNDVLHTHWDAGDFGTVTQVKITKIDGSAFDMNYFVLVSNTETGGAAASGNEQAFIHASQDGVTASHSQMLPSEDWGFPSTQVFLGAQFDGVKAVWFDVANAVDCFGMDNFYIDEAAPGTVSLPSSIALAGLGLFGLAGIQRRRVR